jgi:hypothetical protein
MITMSLTALLLIAVLLLSFERGRFHGTTTILAIVAGVMLAHTVAGQAISGLVTGTVHLFQ